MDEPCKSGHWKMSYFKIAQTSFRSSVPREAFAKKENANARKTMTWLYFLYVHALKIALARKLKNASVAQQSTKIKISHKRSTSLSASILKKTDGKQPKRAKEKGAHERGKRKTQKVKRKQKQKHTCFSSSVFNNVIPISLVNSRRRALGWSGNIKERPKSWSTQKTSRVQRGRRRAGATGPTWGRGFNSRRGSEEAAWRRWESPTDDQAP